MRKQRTNTKTKTRTMMSAMLVMCAMLLWGCPKPPTTAYEQARNALAMAESSLAKKCAKEELTAARLMMRKAKKLMAAEKYEKAKVAFDATRKMAMKAQEMAELRRKECLNQDGNQAISKKEAEPEPKVVQSKEIPVTDKRLKLKRVHFEFNKATLTEKAKQTLRENARYLRKHPKASIQIEGHCDERGTAEYNLALGERRAKVVKKFLAALGVKNARLSIISFGDQKPLITADTKREHAKNRRAEFRVNR